MSRLDFKNILKMFGGGELSPEELQNLFHEALLLTLARASSSDANVEPVEVETVQKIIAQETGSDVSVADIRVAASSELFEKTPLEKYLTKTASKLDMSDRLKIVKALAKVIKSDVRINSSETDYFDMVAKALKIDPTETEGLLSD